MSMKSKRSPWTLLAWPASLLAILFLVWISGYLYWQIRISRAIAELKRGPEKYESIPFYADPELLRIGTRGLPRMVDEFEDALSRGHEDQAFALSCGIGDLLRGAREVDAQAAAASGSYVRTRERTSLDEMKEDCRDMRENWGFYQERCPPWWKWWKGHHGGY